MEIKAELIYSSDQERLDFLAQYNYKLGYEIEEDGNHLVALGKTEKEQEDSLNEKLAKSSLTKREVFLALYEKLGITPDDIRNLIKDPKELIEFDYATEYFRGNPLIDKIGLLLGFSKEDLDYLFLLKQLPKEEPST